MWARVVEVMLGCWLAASPLVFLRGEATTALWTVDLLAAALVVCFAVVSYWPPTCRAHLATLAVAASLLALSLIDSPQPPSPTDQNHVLVGALLIMFAIVPSHAFRPPSGWTTFQGDDPDG